MNSKNTGHHAGNALRSIIIEIGNRVRIMIGRKIREECYRQLQITYALLVMNRQKTQHPQESKALG